MLPVRVWYVVYSNDGRLNGLEIIHFWKSMAKEKALTHYFYFLYGKKKALTPRSSSTVAPQNDHEEVQSAPVVSGSARFIQVQQQANSYYGVTANSYSNI
jgi:hypothetical protein